MVDNQWLRVNRRNPCPVCGKPDWCLLAPDGETAICARTESLKPAGTKGAGWIHRVGITTPLRQHRPRVQTSDKVRAPRPVLDAAYRALLAESSLSELHREKLRRRGLTDAEIITLGYKSLPSTGRRALTARLQANGIRIGGVPGFYLEGGCWQLAGPEGIAIPVKDTKSRIVGLQVRCDNIESGRYKWLSSRGFPQGCSPGAPAHVAGTVSLGSEVWITEGPLKADIAALKLGRLVLAVAGVGNWSSIIPIIREIRPARAIIAFDMDKSSNQAVKLHSEALAAWLIRRDIRTFEADWDYRFKGLDDLVTGEQPCPK